MHSHLRKSVGLEKRLSFVITTQSVDNIQNNLLIFKITNAQLIAFSFGSNSKAELEALALYIPRT